MDCRDVERLTDAYLDGDLSAEASKELQAHLTACPGCRAEYGGLVELLKQPGAVPVPAGLRERIVAAVEERMAQVDAGRRGRGLRRPAHGDRWLMLRRLGWRPWIGAVAASLVFFVMGWVSSLLWTHPQPRPPVGPQGAEPQLTIVVSPWVLSSLAQARALPVPGNALAMVVQAAAMDLAAESLWKEAAPPCPRARPLPIGPLEPEGYVIPPEIGVLPFTYRRMGV